jgi:hypothetical protein
MRFGIKDYLKPDCFETEYLSSLMQALLIFVRAMLRPQSIRVMERPKVVETRSIGRLYIRGSKAKEKRKKRRESRQLVDGLI